MNFVFNGQTYRTLYIDLLRPLTYEESRDLEKSIRINGVQAPILIDEENGIIDGLHRCVISERVGLTVMPVRVVAGLTEDAKRTLAYEMNDCRRQQNAHELSTRRKMRHAIEEAVKENPQVTAPAIAKEVQRKTGKKPSCHTIAKVKEQLCSSGEIAKLPVSVGLNGKSYPSRRDASGVSASAELPLPVPTIPKADVAPKPPKKRLDVAGFRDRAAPIHKKLVMLTASAAMWLSDVGNADLLLGRLEGVMSDHASITPLLEELVQWHRNNWQS